MKQLSTALKNILPTVETTDIVPVEQKYSLTNADLKTITATANALIVKPEIFKEDLSASLKSLLNLQKSPSMTTRTVFRSDGCGADFELESVNFEPLTEEQRTKGLEFVKMMKRPMTTEGLNRLYTKLRLSTRHAKDDVDIDEKVRMAIYVDELKKHPANVVRNVLNIPYEFFPTLNELICDCEREERLLNCFECALKGGV